MCLRLCARETRRAGMAREEYIFILVSPDELTLFISMKKKGSDKCVLFFVFLE